MEIKDLSLEYYTDRMIHKKYFSFVRYGDGEWRALFQTSGWNGHSQKISLKLHNDMKDALLKGSRLTGIIFGMQRYAMRKMPGRIRAFLTQNNLLNISWVDADIFHYASGNGILFPLVRQMRKMEVVIVGPKFLRGLSPQVFTYKHFIEVPLKNAFGSCDAIAKAICATHAKLGQDVVYSFSTGPTTEILIQNLLPKMKKSYLIDFGSVWDIFCGHRSRGYLKGGRYPVSKIQKNLGL